MELELTPALVTVGFVKTGRTYRLISGNGHQALIKLTSTMSGYSCLAAFDVTLCIASAEAASSPYRTPPGQPGPFDCRLLKEVEPSKNPSDPTLYASGWMFSDGHEAVERGRDLRHLLVDTHIPEMKEILDHPTFADILRSAVSADGWYRN